MLRERLLTSLSNMKALSSAVEKACAIVLPNCQHRRLERAGGKATRRGNARLRPTPGLPFLLRVGHFVSSFNLIAEAGIGGFEEGFMCDSSSGAPHGQQLRYLRRDRRSSRPGPAKHQKEESKKRKKVCDRPRSNALWKVSVSIYFLGTTISNPLGN